MATITYRTDVSPVAKATQQPAAAKAPSFFSRVVKAIHASRQRQAEIEIRRMRALIGDRGINFDDALLPFKGE
jgi:hypothetical protein